MEYILEFRNSRGVFSGTPPEIVKQLRETSFMEAGLLDEEYMRNFAERHKVIYQLEIRTDNPENFINDLALSPMVKRLEKELEK